MPKDLGGGIFSLGSFPEEGQTQKTEKRKKRERLNDGNNNGQATHVARKPGPTNLVSSYNFARPYLNNATDSATGRNPHFGKSG